MKSDRQRHPIPRRPLLAALAALLLWPVAAGAQDPAAQRLYTEAQRLQQGGDRAAALEEYQLLVQQFPQDRLAPKALLEIVELRHAQNDAAGTEAALRRLLSDYARSLESAAAFVKQAEIQVENARRREDLEEARSNFRRVPLLYGRAAYPNLEERLRARLRTGELSLLLGDAENAAAEFLAALEDEPPSRLTGRARLRLATAFLELDEWTAAAEILSRLAAEGASEAGSPTSTPADRAAAEQLLGLIHRREVRPRSGLNPWTTIGRFPTPGLALREPSGVAAAADGRLLVVDAKQSLVALLSPAGEVLERATVADPVRPGFLGTVPYVVTETHVALPFDDQRTSFLEPRPGKEVALKGLLSAERGPFGDWFVAAKGWKGVLAYETRRKGQELLATSRADLEDLAVDRQGRLYLLDRRGKEILRMGLDRRGAQVFARGDWKRAAALAIDLLGNVYVLDRGAAKIEMFDPEGKRMTSLGPQLGGNVELRNPVDLSVDGTGRLFITDTKLPYLVVLD